MSPKTLKDLSRYQCRRYDVTNSTDNVVIRVHGRGRETLSTVFYPLITTLIFSKSIVNKLSSNIY